MTVRKSGITRRVADLRIDAVARQAASAVRQAPDERASERFMARYLDHLYSLDNAAHGLAPIHDSDMSGSRRRRRRRE